MFSGHSKVVKLKDVVTIMDDKRKPINEGERSAMKDGELYPYYGATGVVDYINDYLTDERLLCIAEDCGNYGPGEESSYIIEGKAWVNNHAHVVKPNDELCDITYLHNYLKVTDLLSFVSGTTRKKLTQKAMSDLDIILPQIDKQREYVSICDQADKSKFMRSKSQFIEMFSGNKTEYVLLSSICSIFIDGDWIESKDQSESGIRLIQTGNIGCGYYKDKGDKAKYISEETFNKLHCTEVYPGDILISRLPDPVGRACIIPEGLGKCITAVDCTIIRLSDKMLPEFFVTYTNTPEYLTQIKSTLAGSTRLRVSRGNLGKVHFPLPSIEQQQAFVSIVNQADKSKLICLLWKHCHCRDVYTK